MVRASVGTTGVWSVRLADQYGRERYASGSERWPPTAMRAKSVMNGVERSSSRIPGVLGRARRPPQTQRRRYEAAGTGDFPEWSVQEHCTWLRWRRRTRKSVSASLDSMYATITAPPNLFRYDSLNARNRVSSISWWRRTWFVYWCVDRIPVLNSSRRNKWTAEE